MFQPLMAWQLTKKQFAYFEKNLQQTFNVLQLMTVIKG